ncbi:MAG TPA: DMT family transporter [Mycobacteriales bacterium]|nr:DMT family transporter [Mycobacteriales bacterium]
MSRRGWALFAAMCLIWGIPYLLIRVAVRDLSPASVVFFRTAAATLLLLPIAVRRGALVDVFRRWRPLLLFTAIEVTAPWWLLSTAEQHLSSALTGLLIAAVPLFGVLLSRLVGTAEVFDRVRLFGLALGVAGVGSLVGLQIGHVNGLAVLAVLVTALGYAAGPLVLSRRLADLPAVGVTTASLAITTVVWAAPAALSMPEHVSGDVVWSMVGLAVVCTAAAFVVFFALIAEVGPTRATVITYVNPAVAILLGVAVLGEHFTLGMAIGFPLVIAGSVLATLQRKDAVTDDGDVAELPLVVAEASVSGWASSHRDRHV